MLAICTFLVRQPISFPLSPCLVILLTPYTSKLEGDGEISFCGAIEMAGIITINFKVIKNGMANLALKSPIYIPGPVEPQFGPGRYIYFEGFSVDEHGKQHYMDVTVAYRQTSLRKSCQLPRGYFAPLRGWEPLVLTKSKAVSNISGASATVTTNPTS